MSTTIDHFIEGKYYVMSGQGENWSDFDGPFDDVEDAKMFLGQFDNAFTPPERHMVVVKVGKYTLDLVKENGRLLAIAGSLHG
jgi:hypothetical protein